MSWEERKWLVSLDGHQADSLIEAVFLKKIPFFAESFFFIRIFTVWDIEVEYINLEEER